MKHFLLFACIIICCQSFAQQPGTPDISFGENGKVGNDSLGTSYASALQKDGKILIVADQYQTFDDPPDSIGSMILRLLPDGSVDKSFADNGLAFFPGGNYVTGIVVQRDGKIVAGRGDGIVQLARYNTDGSNDKTYGMEGMTTIKFDSLHASNLYGMAIQPDDKVLMGGIYYTTYTPRGEVRYRQSLLMRFNADGSPDLSFGDSGRVLSDLHSSVHDDEIKCLALQPDGKIITGGQTHFTYNFFVHRYLPDGSTDKTFGNDGLVTTNIPNGNETVYSLAVQKDGKIVAAGDCNEYIPYNNMAAIRYNTDGSIDSSFAKNGLLVINFKNYSSVTKVLLQADDKLVLTGSATIKNSDFAAVRLLLDGSIDSSFIQNTYDLGSEDFASASLLQPDGKIIMAGQSSIANSYFYSLSALRLNGDGVKNRIPFAKIKRWIRNHWLQWQPLNDDDISYYSVQQSSNGVNAFREIGRIKAMNGQSSGVNNVYSYSLNNASAQGSKLTAQSLNYYRITAVSTTGSNIVSDVISDESFSSITVSPNPVKNVLKISGLPANQKSTINIINRNGNILMTAIAASSTYNMNVAQLHSGVYNVVVTSNGEMQTIKVVKE